MPFMSGLVVSVCLRVVGKKLDAGLARAFVESDEYVKNPVELLSVAILMIYIHGYIRRCVLISMVAVNCSLLCYSLVPRYL